MNRPTSPHHGQAPTAIDTVYSALRTEILNATLTPGSRLRIEALRQRFDVGSSTIREALSRLLVDKLVLSREQRGFLVAPISLKDFREITTMRIVLEVQAVREAVAAGDEAWENRLLAAAHQLQKTEEKLTEGKSQPEVAIAWEERNREFHDALVASCTNDWLLRFRATVFAHGFRYRRISMPQRDIPRDVRAEHQAIFEAALARDADRAASATKVHIRNSIAPLEAGIISLFPEE